MRECAPFNIGTRQPARHNASIVRAGWLAMTRAAGALLIVNDSVEIASSSGADGVHMGRDDGDVADARRRLPHRLLGVSCYNELELAHAPRSRAGADAIAFGSMYPSVTKPAAVRAPLSLLSDARAAWPQQRIIAIGGINAENVATVAAAGADAAAVLDAIFGAENPASAARELYGDSMKDEAGCRHDKQRTTV